MRTLSALFCVMMALATVASLDGQHSPGEEEPEEGPEEGLEEGLEDPYVDTEAWSCPEGWKESPSRCVRYVPEKMTWAKAEENCQNMKGNLASVSDDVYIDEIHKVLESAGVDSGEVWVGGSNTAKDPTWSWSDGSYRRFTDWCSGDAKNRENHCLQLTLGEEVCLDDKKCDADLPSVCIINPMGLQG